MDRANLIRGHFDRSMRLIELGPSYSPIVPKSDGWQTTIIDHASQADLVAKYGTMGVATIDSIEPVDYIWQDGPLTALIPPAMHGTFDGLIASHVGEHFPDLIAFLKDAATLLKPNGIVALALPDKRVCFDFFQPTTMAGDLVAAHLERRTRHRRRTFFNQAAYQTIRNGVAGWPHTGGTAPFVLVHPLSLAQLAYDTADEAPGSEYSDTHAWTFTPKSFELLMLELNLLGHTEWAIRASEPASGVEFYVWLERKRLAIPDAGVNPLRLSLLTEMVYEWRDPIAQLDAIAGSTPSPVVDIETVLRVHETALEQDDPDARAAAWQEFAVLARHNERLAPRLVEHALERYKRALLDNREAAIRAAWTELAEVVARLPGVNLRLRAAVYLLRSSAVSRSVFLMRRTARPLMLWAFRT